jgi:dihydrofolate reductase
VSKPTEVEKMSKLTESVLVSLNGVTSEPLSWAGPYFGEGSAARALEVLRRSEAMLMGRGTYEVFSKQWPKAPGEYAGHLNRMRKYVFSSTLRNPEWENTVVISGDVVEEVTRMKETAKAELTVYGHGEFGQTLSDAGLVDELTLTLVPVFVPDGKAFYRAGRQAAWRLVSVGEGPDPGLAVVMYRPARASSDSFPAAVASDGLTPLTNERTAR